MLGLIILSVYTLFILIVCVALEVKIDWTKDKELLIWYTVTDEFTGTRERKFVKILKL